ncbi:unnamed protein product [Schistosoma spindalis]|nr:unnamed protein product [Schistosoma spindale]
MSTMTKGTESEILEVFEECQLNNLSHDRLCVKLKNIYDNTRFTHFADDFFELCRYSLVSSERSSYRERTIDFITKFALFCGKSDDSSQDTLNNRLLLKLFLFCIKYNECPNPAVRFRCMQIIHKLLDGIGDNGIMPEELYRTLQSILLRRVYDTKVSVRVEAIQALSRMQDPTDAECPVVEAFIWLTRHDPTAEVRRAALAAMVLTTRTLPSLVERCRDLADNVRRAAYKLLASRGILRPLSIAKRIRILQDGLSDRSEEVRKATKELVLAWFNGTNRDPVLLLRRLDPEGDPSTSQKALDSLFEMLSLDDLLKVVQEWSPNYLNSDRILKSDCLTPEATFFWRALVEFIHKRQTNIDDITTTTIKSTVHLENENNDEENNPLQQLADLVQPSVSVYVDLAKSVVDKLVQTVLAQEFDEKAIEQECVVEQILSMAGSLDLSDEFGRRRLVSLVHDWITSQQVSGTLAPQLLKLHAILEPSLRRRINSVIEMISELCDPVEPQNSLKSTISIPIESNENYCLTKEIECTTTQPVLSKKKEISIRLKIASLEVRMNELNEALHDCVSRKEFERATELRDACNKLDIERTELLQELRGNIGVLADKPPVSPSSGSDEQIKNENKEDLNADGGINNDKNDGDDDNEVDAVEDATQTLIKRCSSSVLFKANRMAALIIQQSPTLWSLPASLRSLLDSLILPSMQHPDVAVRNQAILALGLCCTMDLPLTLQYIHVFYSAMRVDHLMISETALGCIIDCLLIYGFRPFHDANINPNSRLVPTDTIVVDEDDDDDDDEEEQNMKSSKHDYAVLTRQSSQDSTNQSHNYPQGILVRCDEMSKTAYRLLKPITSLLEKESDDGLRSTSALGLAKLLIYDRIVSSHILSLLLLLWFNPISEETPQLRRGLAYFFADYACANGIGMDAFEHQSALTNAVLPTLTTLIRAPASSSLSEVEPNDVASLLARLTDTTHLKNRSESKNLTSNQEGKNDHINEDNEDSRPYSNKSKTISSIGQMDEKIINPHHDRLVSILSTEVLKAPQSAEAKLYLRMIFQLRPSTENIQIHKELLNLVDSMSKFADRSLNLMLHRFRKQLVEKMERLGIDSTRLNESILSENENDKVNTSPFHNDDDDSNHTLMNNEGIQQSQPTLLGSARVNFHLVNSSEHHNIERNQGNATMIFSQSNRTMCAGGNPLLDKSSHQNLLDFSDDDDDDDDHDHDHDAVDIDLTPTSKPAVSHTNPSNKQIQSKKNTRITDTHQKNINNNLPKKLFHKTSRGKVVLQSSDNENIINNNNNNSSRSRNAKKLKHSQKKIVISSSTSSSSPSPTSSSSSPAPSSSSVLVNGSRRSTRLSNSQKLNRKI